jgi:hypothetical protein
MMMYVSFIVDGNIKFAIKALLCNIQYFYIVDTIKQLNNTDDELLRFH